MRMLGPAGGCFLRSGPRDEGSWLQAKRELAASVAISFCSGETSCYFMLPLEVALVPVITQVIKKGRESLWGQTGHLETWPRITIRDSNMAQPSVQVMETQDTSLFKKTVFIDVAILGYESELDTEKYAEYSS